MNLTPLMLKIVYRQGQNLDLIEDMIIAAVEGRLGEFTDDQIGWFTDILQQTLLEYQFQEVLKGNIPSTN